MSIPAETTGEPATDNVAPSSRPRRAIEQDYLAALAESISLEDWREIVRAAVARAKIGDARARKWLAGFLGGECSLLALAALEYNDETPDRVVQRAAADQRERNGIRDMLRHI